MKQAKDNGILSDLYVAFSREQKQKIYVQDLLAQEENSKQLYDIINNNKGYIYVCGGTSMGRAVKDVITEVFIRYGGLSNDKAKG